MVTDEYIYREQGYDNDLEARGPTKRPTVSDIVIRILYWHGHLYFSNKNARLLVLSQDSRVKPGVNASRSVSQATTLRRRRAHRIGQCSKRSQQCDPLTESKSENGDPPNALR